MTETNASIHVLADETLGGIKREYVEVDRKAEVGEKIITVESCKEFEVGEVFTVTERNRWYDGSGISVNETDIGLYHREYRVLEPTDIVHIDGPDGTAQRYELTDRKAEVGEKVIIVALDPGLATESDLGKVTTVTELCSEDDIETDKLGWVKRSEYRVLVPVEADEPQPADPIFAIGNVAQEVAKLKRTVERLENEIDTLHKDNRTLGEELARLKEQVGEKTQTNVDALAEAFAALKRAGL